MKRRVVGDSLLVFLVTFLMVIGLSTVVEAEAPTVTNVRDEQKGSEGSVVVATSHLGNLGGDLIFSPATPAGCGG
jgi:hypothetical protein